jgi:hypothetical protein
MYIVWVISPPAPHHHPLLPNPLDSRQNMFSLISNLVEKKTKAVIRKTKCFY